MTSWKQLCTRTEAYALSMRQSVRANMCRQWNKAQLTSRWQKYSMEGAMRVLVLVDPERLPNKIVQPHLLAGFISHTASQHSLLVFHLGAHGCLQPECVPILYEDVR